jgi:hypothetical protein
VKPPEGVPPANAHRADALLLLLVLVLIAVLSHRVRAAVLARSDLVVDTRAPRLDLPALLSPSARGDLERLPLRRNVSAFDGTLVPSLARALGEIPWVDEVESVRIQFPARVTFSLRPLVPIARVREGEREWLVARSGRAVPEAAIALPVGAHPLVAGLPPLSRATERAHALDAGLAVVDALRSRGLVARLPLVAVDVANWNGRRNPLASEIVLETAGGAAIDWGRPAGAPRAPTHEERLSKLERVLARGVPLERGARLSLRWHEPVLVPPLEGEVRGIEVAARSTLGR